MTKMLLGAIPGPGGCPETPLELFTTPVICGPAGVTGAIVEGSLELAVTDPPPETLTWFVTVGGAPPPTLTLTVIGG